MLITASAALVLALLQSQDTIRLRNGQVLAVDGIQTETYTEVGYRKGGSDGRKPANEVLEVKHSTAPRPLADFAAAEELMVNGDYRRAIGLFEVVLKDRDLGAGTRYGWVRQHALWRILLCSASAGDLKAIPATADRLLTEVPDTFFYAHAMLKKAEALQDLGDAKGAEATFKKLQADVAAKGLHESWAREAELGLALLDVSSAPADKQRKLASIAEKNQSSPDFADVANRARVEVGNAMVEARQYKDAQARFEAIIKAGTTDPTILAAAYSGLGDCAFNLAVQTFEADRKKAEKLYEEAALHFLRVAATYPEAYRLVPRAMCFAGIAMKNAGAREDALQMARKLKGSYPNSTWKEKLFQELGLQG